MRGGALSTPWSTRRRLGESFSTKASAWPEAENTQITGPSLPSYSAARITRSFASTLRALKEFDMICAEARKRAKYEATD
jgi:hypothetical protein